MRFRVILAPEAVEAMSELRAYDRARVRAALEALRINPARVSRSRIKRLRGIEKPEYRLRVGDIRVFYDVAPPDVHVLAIVAKSEAQAWLEQQARKS